MRNAFILVFIDIKKYSNALKSLSLQQGCVDEHLAPLLIMLFNAIKEINPKQDIHSQLFIYFSNIITLFKRLTWSAWLCEKLTQLDNEFLAELLEIEPFNRNLAQAIPDTFLIKRLNENTVVLQKKIPSTQKNNIIFFSSSFQNNTQQSSSAVIRRSLI